MLSEDIQVLVLAVNFVSSYVGELIHDVDWDSTLMIHLREFDIIMHGYAQDLLFVRCLYE